MFGDFLTCSCRDSTVLEIVKGFDKFRQLEVLLGLSQSPFCLILLHPRYPTEVLFVEILFVFVSNPVGVHLFHFLAKMLIIPTKHSNPMIFCTAVCTFSLKLSRRCMLRTDVLRSDLSNVEFFFARVFIGREQALPNDN